MNDERDGTDAGAVSAEQEDQVRRLLADAGGPVPTPPDVVARLDATLSRLVAERDAEARSEADTEGTAENAAEVATVTPLAVRRRRWPKLLLAAAAVVVGGYGVGAALTGSMAGDGASSSAGGSGVSADRAEAGGSASSGGADSFARESSKGMLDASGRVLRLSSADFDAEVARLAGRTPSSSTAQDGAGGGTAARKDERNAARKGVGRCAAPPSRSRDTWYVVRYDGRAATLVVGPERNGTVRAQVFSCDGTMLVRDSTVDLN